LIGGVPPVHLRGATPERLAQLLPDVRLEARLWRRVVARLVHEDADGLEGIPGLSRRAAAALAEARCERLGVADRRLSPCDGFAKYLFRAADGVAFEAVRIPLERPRWSVCVSSQAGCGLACAFCETGRLGFTRHLEAWEMVEQVLTVRREAPQRPVTGVVFQGQGEPLQNYDNVMQAAALLRHPCGARIRGDRITISTVGLLPMIERYTEEGHPYRLILSLTSAFDATRAALVPAGRSHSVAELAAAMRRHAARHGGPVHLGWVLMAGINTAPAEAAELARLFAGVPLRVSVIDVNDGRLAPEVNSGARASGAHDAARLRPRTPDPVPGRFERASDEERGRFLSALAAHGIAFVRRYSGGPDIDAACGMLAARARGGEALAAPPR
jgi:23S rRNA (adenine2503-C2)-methyltransferase